eukprot:Opistho-2@42631
MNRKAHQAKQSAPWSAPRRPKPSTVPRVDARTAHTKQVVTGALNDLIGDEELVAYIADVVADVAHSVRDVTDLHEAVGETLIRYRATQYFFRKASPIFAEFNFVPFSD